jgi:chromosome segregation ATPase
VKGLVAQLIKVKDVSTATALEVAAGNRVIMCCAINS